MPYGEIKNRLCFLLIIFLFSGCISFKIKIPEDPGAGIGYFIITDFFNGNSDPGSRPAESKISRGNRIIYSVIKVMDVEEKMEVIWRWYTPDGEPARISPAVIVNEGADYLEYFVVWDSIENPLFKDRNGSWTVTVHVNGKFFSGRKFVIH